MVEELKRDKAEAEARLAELMEQDNRILQMLANNKADIIRVQGILDYINAFLTTKADKPVESDATEASS